MLKFQYTVTINALPASDDKQFVEKLTGTLEAPDQSSAYERAKIFAWDRCQQLKEQRGGIFGYEDMQVELAPAVLSKVMTEGPLLPDMQCWYCKKYRSTRLCTAGKPLYEAWRAAMEQSDQVKSLDHNDPVFYEAWRAAFHTMRAYYAHQFSN